MTRPEPPPPLDWDAWLAGLEGHWTQYVPREPNGTYVVPPGLYDALVRAGHVPPSTPSDEPFFDTTPLPGDAGSWSNK